MKFIKLRQAINFKPALVDLDKVSAFTENEECTSVHFNRKHSILVLESVEQIEAIISPQTETVGFTYYRYYNKLDNGVGSFECKLPNNFKDGKTYLNGIHFKVISGIASEI